MADERATPRAAGLMEARDRCMDGFPPPEAGSARTLPERIRIRKLLQLQRVEQCTELPVLSGYRGAITDQSEVVGALRAGHDRRRQRLIRLVHSLAPPHRAPRIVARYGDDARFLPGEGRLFDLGRVLRGRAVGLRELSHPAIDVGLHAARTAL